MECVGVKMTSMSNFESDIEAMMDDPVAWEAPAKASKKKSEQRQRGVVVSVRLNGDELSQLQRASDAVGQSVSGFMRTCALRDSSVGHSLRVAGGGNTSAQEADLLWLSDIRFDVPQYRSVMLANHG